MNLEVINLREDRPVTLTSYIIDKSSEIEWEKRPAVVICPGGGFQMTSDREAEPIAVSFLGKGYNAFVLRYTTGSMGVKKIYPEILYDLANAIIMIKNNAEKWNVDTERIAIIGFSAGGTLAAMYSVHWHREWLLSSLNVNSDILKVAAVILGYPTTDFELMLKIIEEEGDKSLGFFDLTPKDIFYNKCSLLTGNDNFTNEQLKILSPINYIDDKTVPTFLWHTANDDLIDVENSLKYACKLASNNIPFELHIFEDGIHGLSLANKVTAAALYDDKRNNLHINPSVEKWTELMYTWLKKYLED
ncbi:alpha/beta hydrolase [Caloramator sp. E03]|uniref:alpha/beta hydrolase n=1 Tax=Caloramator sp. E03 TaxID=2576307 RepID=UPI0011103934|nr:alpha/beta hydrolase [Caloramator sp. E03]QCX34296.1 alpha/beta hydrolase [Caloramator sp. E03]